MSYSFSLGSLRQPVDHLESAAYSARMIRLNSDLSHFGYCSGV